MRPDARLFTEADLERLAGPARFQRGRSLLDMVDDEYEDEYSLCATVTDGREYLAMVHHRVGRLAGECDCPDAMAVPFCEHSVAVGLSYLYGQGTLAERSSSVVRRESRLFTEADLERLAGPARFQRGRSLLDMVDDEYEDEYSLCATVTDGREYLAMVHHRVGRLAGECDCPDAKAVPFCEHSVAEGLSYLSEGDPDS